MISQRYNEQMGNYLAKLAKASKPPTNADRIRQMSDEELAVICENGCPPQHKCPPMNREEMGLKSVCQKCWLDWLKSPVTDDG